MDIKGQKTLKFTLSGKDCWQDELELGAKVLAVRLTHERVISCSRLGSESSTHLVETESKLVSVFARRVGRNIGKATAYQIEGKE